MNTCVFCIMSLSENALKQLVFDHSGAATYKNNCFFIILERDNQIIVFHNFGFGEGGDRSK